MDLKLNVVQPDLNFKEKLDKQYLFTNNNNDKIL